MLPNSNHEKRSRKHLCPAAGGIDGLEQGIRGLVSARRLCIRRPGVVQGRHLVVGLKPEFIISNQ